MRVIAGAVMLAVLSCPAVAQEMPRFDVEAYCKKIASFGGSYSAVTDESCFEMEQSSYNNLKGSWSQLPDRMRDYCVKIAKFGGEGSYVTLESCIEMEEESAGKNSARTFEY